MGRPSQGNTPSVIAPTERSCVIPAAIHRPWRRSLSSRLLRYAVVAVARPQRNEKMVIPKNAG